MAKKVTKKPKKSHKEPKSLIKRPKFVKGRDRTNSLLVGTLPRVKGRELKWFDTRGDTVITAAGNKLLHVTSLNIVPRGTGPNERVGQKLFPKGMLVSYELYRDNSAVDEPLVVPQLVRVVFYEDTQCNGTGAVYTDIFDQAASISSPVDLRNIAAHRRFKILDDRLIDINTQYMGMYNAIDEEYGYRWEAYTAKKYDVPAKDTVTWQVDNNDGALADIRSVNYGMMMIGGTSMADSINARYTVRFLYTDS